MRLSAGRPGRLRPVCYSVRLHTETPAARDAGRSYHGDTMRTMNDLRIRLDPKIRAIGIREVSRLSGVPTASIHMWLEGRRPIQYDRARDVARACGYDLTMSLAKRR